MADEDIQDGEIDDDENALLDQPTGSEHSAFLPDEELHDQLPNEAESDERTALTAAHQGARGTTVAADSSAAFNRATEADLLDETSGRASSQANAVKGALNDALNAGGLEGIQGGVLPEQSAGDPEVPDSLHNRSSRGSATFADPIADAGETGVFNGEPTVGSDAGPQPGAFADAGNGFAGTEQPVSGPPVGGGDLGSGQGGGEEGQDGSQESQGGGVGSGQGGAEESQEVLSGGQEGQGSSEEGQGGGQEGQGGGEEGQGGGQEGQGGGEEGQGGGEEGQGGGEEGQGGGEEGGVNPIIGDKFDNNLVGTDGRDMINAQDGDDTASGGAGDDLIMGKKGDDWLEGGLGDDTLEGGHGDDTFAFSNADFDGNGWTDVVDGQGQNGNPASDYDTIDLSSVTQAWTLEVDGAGAGAESTNLTSPQEYTQGGAEFSGTISFADGSEIVFDNIEKVDWS
jgi:hypothetical protein